MRTALLALAAIAVLVLSTNAHAGGRWQRNQNGQFQGQAERPVNPRQTYPYRYYQGNMMYPKYYFGLHERQMQSIGVPSGDIGIRGNGITATPW
jgi:hypothetical protein